MRQKTYELLANLVSAWINCQASGNQFAAQHEATIEAIMQNTAPHGSGFDNGTKLDLDASEKNKLVFSFGFHHMDEAGGYCGWSQTTMTLTPAFVGGFDMAFDITDLPEASGEDSSSFGEFLGDTFTHWLRYEIDWNDYVKK